MEGEGGEGAATGKQERGGGTTLNDRKAGGGGGGGGGEEGDNDDCGGSGSQRKILEVRNVLRLTSCSTCKRHAYHNRVNVLSVHVDASTEILVRCDDSGSTGEWERKINGVIRNLREEEEVSKRKGGGGTSKS